MHSSRRLADIFLQRIRLSLQFAEGRPDKHVKGLEGLTTGYSHVHNYETSCENALLRTACLTDPFEQVMQLQLRAQNRVPLVTRTFDKPRRDKERTVLTNA